MVKYQIKAAPLPVNFHGTPQDFINAFIERLEITSDATSFSSSTAQPVGNEGPWFRNGNELFVWDETTSTYIPLDLGASFTPQIWIGETAPDETIYPLWLKLSGVTMVGLFTFHSGSWIAQDLEIADGSITDAFLADFSVTTGKILNGAVTVVKLAGGIPMNKWELGVSRAFARTKSDGSTPEWRQTFFVTPPIAFGGDFGQYVTVPHGLTASPHEVEVSVIYNGVTDFHGVSPGDEFVANGINLESVQKNSTNIVSAIWTLASIKIPMPDGTAQNLDTDWKVLIRYSAP